MTDLRLDDDLHDGEERVRLLTGVHALEPLVAVLVGLLQRHVQVVVRLLRGKVLRQEGANKVPFLKYIPRRFGI